MPQKVHEIRPFKVICIRSKEYILTQFWSILILNLTLIRLFELRMKRQFDSLIDPNDSFIGAIECTGVALISTPNLNEKFTLSFYFYICSKHAKRHPNFNPNVLRQRRPTSSSSSSGGTGVILSPGAGPTVVVTTNTASSHKADSVNSSDGTSSEPQSSDKMSDSVPSPWIFEKRKILVSPENPTTRQTKWPRQKLLLTNIEGEEEIEYNNIYNNKGFWISCKTM